MVLCPSPPLSDSSCFLWVAGPPQSLGSLPYSWAGAAEGVAAQCPGQDRGWGPRFLCNLVSAVPQQQGCSGAWSEAIWKGSWSDQSTDVNPTLLLNHLSTDTFWAIFCLPLCWAGSCMHRMHFRRYQLDKQHPVAQSPASAAAMKGKKKQGTKKKPCTNPFLENKGS